MEVNPVPPSWQREQGYTLDFPVDLSREDYIEFNLLVAKTKGVLRHYREMLIFGGFLMVISIGILVLQKLRFGQVSLAAVLMMLIFLLLVGGPLAGLPGHLRRGAATAYDRTVEQGYRYAGRVQLEENRIRKTGSSSAVAIQLDERAAMIESRNMLVILSPGSRAIVIPARYLSRENAAVLLQRLRNAVKGENQKVFSPLLPAVRQEAEKMVLEEDDDNNRETEPLTLEIQYTSQEFYILLADRALRTFLKRLPFYSAFAVIAGVLCGLAAGVLWGIAIGVCILSAVYLLSVEGGRLRAKKLTAGLTKENMTLRLVLTENGLLLRRRNGEERRIPWDAVKRAVARPSCVEFTARDTFVRIPRRCIPDMDRLKDLVDDHIRPGTRRN